MSTPLQRIREKEGYLQADVAEHIGIHPANLGRIESGKQTPKPDVARRLFEFYEGAVSLGAVYDGTYADERGLD